MVDNIIGNSLKSYFKVHGITQRDIAERLDVKQSYIAAIFKGKAIGRNTAKKFADEYGFNASFLITGVGNLMNEENTPNEENEASKQNCHIDMVVNSAPADTAEYWKAKYDECYAELQRKRGISEGLKMALGVGADTQKVV